MSEPEIGLFGCTGQVGTGVARWLAALGSPARLILRRPDVSGSLPGVTVYGDLDLPDSLVPALSGLRTLILITADSPVQADQGLAAIAAARTANVRFLVIVSAMLAGEHRPKGFAASHAKIEAAAIASGIACQIIRPSFFMQSFFMIGKDIAAGRMVLPGRTARVAFVDLADVVECIARCAVREKPLLDRPLILTGSRSIGFGEVAALIGGHVGRRIKHVALPVWAGRLLLPLLLGRFRGLSMAYLFARLEAGREAVPTEDVKLVLDREASRFEAFLDREGDRFNAP